MMNEEKLNMLLERKKSAPADFPKSPEAFAGDFFAEIEREKIRFPRIAITGMAAGVLICTVFAAALLFSAGTKNDSYIKLTEAVRLFGNDAAVLFVNDELCTGERTGETAENLIMVSLPWKEGQKIQLSLTCADSDTILLDTPELSGEIVTSRCDGETLILDMDLTVHGRTVRMEIPVIRDQGNRYNG